MRLDLGKLRLRGGDRHESAYVVEVEPIVLGGAEYQVHLPEGAMITVDRVAGGFVVRLAVNAKAYGPCSRCLREVEVPLDAEQDEFAPTEEGGWTESDTCVHVEDLVVDVPGLAREALVLALPPQMVCSTSCKGLCPECGEDLNKGPCGCGA
jgi:uncharacterized protein